MPAVTKKNTKKNDDNITIPTEIDGGNEIVHLQANITLLRRQKAINVTIHYNYRGLL